MLLQPGLTGRTPRRTALVVAALAVAAPLPASAASRPTTLPAPALVVTAARGAVATFQVTRTTRLSFQDARIASTGRYAGIHLFSATGTALDGVVSFGAERPLYLGRRTGTVLPVGTYHVVALAEAPLRVVVPLDLGEGLTVHAATPAPQSFEAVERVLAPAGAAAEELRTPLPSVAGPSRVVAVSRVEPAIHSGALAVTLCAPMRGAACGSADLRVRSQGSDNALGGGRSAVVAFAVPGWTLAGRRDVAAAVETTPVAGATFSLTALRYATPTR